MPGLNDPDWPLDKWLKKFKEYEGRGATVELVLLVFRAKYRPDTGDVFNLNVMSKLLKASKTANVAAVFTFCDLYT